MRGPEDLERFTAAFKENRRRYRSLRRLPPDLRACLADVARLFLGRGEIDGEAVDATVNLIRDGEVVQMIDYVRENFRKRIAEERAQARAEERATVTDNFRKQIAEERATVTDNFRKQIAEERAQARAEERATVARQYETRLAAERRKIAALERQIARLRGAGKKPAGRAASPASK